MATKKIEMMKEENIRIEVEFVGSPIEKKGLHIVHFNGGTVKFINGKANVLKVTAAKLKEEGLIK